MNGQKNVYIAIDLKSFYASVECIERNLDPLTTHLVVADESKTEKTICLAVSPSLKQYGVSGRARLFEDIHVYSIDEVFIDATHYLQAKKMTPREFAKMIILDIFQTTGITATAGVGTNLYLCKVAMDIVAKHIRADKDGVRIAQLNEERYRKYLWSHTPITDFGG